MNTNRCLVITLVIAAGFSLAWAQDPSPPDTQTPVRRPQTSPPPATPAPTPNQTLSPSRPATAAPQTESTSQTQPADEDEETVPPPRRLAEGDEGTADTLGEGRHCTRLRGIEKAECERRDNPRDDLPAGVTSSQKP